MTILIIVLPAVAAVLALVFVVSRRGGRLGENKKKIDVKMNELAAELEKTRRKK